MTAPISPSRRSGGQLPPRRSGGQLIVDSLRAQGTDTVFCVPGESFLEVLDALHDSPIRTIACRHENGAAFMAEAYGKLTGRPGVCIATRGPGACNASIGIHTAYQDSTPLVFLIGQVARSQTEREAFQEVDFRRMFGQMSKWTAQIDQPERIPEMIGRAFHVAASGRPGPVVLALPEDMLRESCAAADAAAWPITRPAPAPAAMADMEGLLAASRRPMLLVGGSGWSDAGLAALEGFAERFALPVCCSFRRQDLIDNAHPCYAGELGIAPAPALVARMREADLILAVGTRLGEITSQGYTLPSVPEPAQTLIHVHPSAEELGRVYRARLMIQSGGDTFAAAAAALAPPSAPAWTAWRDAARQDYLDSLTPTPLPETGLDLAQVMAQLQAALPERAILCNDAGNFSGWPQRFLSYGRRRRQLAPANGAMGYGVPAAVAAALCAPDRLVVAFIGDGGFMMTGQEIATARQYGAAPILIVFDNGTYGTIRMHQERRFPGRVIATALANPDFAALAQAHGTHGETVTRTGEFLPAFERARASGRAAVIALKMTPETISTRTTLSAIRDAAQAKK